jgi:tyrosine-protein kinase Etk/Wzc
MRGESAAVADELDLGAVGRALIAKKMWVIGPTVLIAALAFAAVNVMTPRYKSEARILVEGRENVFLRPEAEKLAERERTVDPEAVASQVQLVLSRDLARKVIQDLKLTERSEFDSVVNGGSLLRQVLGLAGLGRNPLNMSAEERVLEAYYERLTAFAVDKSRVIVVEFSSADPELAATAANTIAEAYLERQQSAKQDQTRLASQWLGAEIDTLRKRVAEAEAKVESFRAKSNLFVGTNNITLSNQQMGEFNSQLALARSQKAEAEAKAKLIRNLVKSGQPTEFSDIINSELIRRLAEQGATLRAQLAEQSSTLLGNHPRIKELKAQIADLEAQVRREAEKLVRSFENDARIAGAKLETLTASLDQLKANAAASGGQDVELRALEREAKAQRDLLESYLAKYREANARDSLASAPAEARIISRAILSNTPSFPKKLPIVLIATLATLVLSTAAITTGELLAGNVYRDAADVEEEATLASSNAIEPIAPAVASPQETVVPSETAAITADEIRPPDPRLAARQAIAELVEALRAATASEGRQPIAAARSRRSPYAVGIAPPSLPGIECRLNSKLIA